MGDSNSTSVFRSMHDLGLAAWFGGSLFGVFGLNAASTEAPDRLAAERIASIGWAKWTPVNNLAIGTHAIGGLGLIARNRRRVQVQPNAAGIAIAKGVVTAAAAGASIYSRILGKKIEQAVIHRSSTASSSSTTLLSGETTQRGAATATGETVRQADKIAGQAVGDVAEKVPGDVSDAERQLTVMQFAVPVLTGAALVLGVVAGEQERSQGQLRGVAQKVSSAIGLD